MARRAPGTGAIIIRSSNGRDTYYGKWTHDGKQVKRRLGLKRPPGTTDGLTRKQAEEALRDLMGSHHADERPDKRLTLEEVGERYVENMRRRGLKPSSIRTVEVVQTRWLTPHLGDRYMDDVKPQDVDDLIAEMEEAGLQPKTIRNYIGNLSAVYNFARDPKRRETWATRNPVEAVELPAAVDYGEIRFITADEIHALADAAQPGPFQRVDRAMYLTAAMTGLRLGEQLALRWRDVDLPAGRVRVRWSWDRKAKEMTKPKSRRSERSVPLADELAGEIERYGKWRYGEDFDPADVADQLVFCDEYGQALNENRLRERYKLALTAAKIEPHRYHDLRHTYGTLMVGTGVPIRTLQEWMGHKDIATTQRYADYAPSPEHEREYVAQAFRGTSRGTTATETGRNSAQLSTPKAA